MGTVLASAANERYGYHLLNMLGSVERNSDLFDRIVVYDLGLDDRQRRLIRGLRSVEVRSVPPFAAHWAKCFSWKPWIWTHTDGCPDVLPRRRLNGAALPGRGALHNRPRGLFRRRPGDRARGDRPVGLLLRSTTCRASQPHASTSPQESSAFARAASSSETSFVPTYEDVLLGRKLGYSRRRDRRRSTGA